MYTLPWPPMAKLLGMTPGQNSGMYKGNLGFRKLRLQRSQLSAFRVLERVERALLRVKKLL